MRKQIYLFLSSALLLSTQLLAQSALAPLNADYYHLIDRYEIAAGQITPLFHSNLKGYEREAIATFADSLQATQADLSGQDRFNLQYLVHDNWEWVDSAGNQSRKPILKHFYKVNSDLYHVRTKDFDLHVNPVLQIGYGSEPDGDVNPSINTRGVQVRGVVDGKVGFYSFIGETQMFSPEYVRNFRVSNLTVPHEGFWKGFKDNGVDFFTARGYVTFDATKHINLQFGHDRFKIGNGYRSMILSDNSAPYLFLKMNTQVWKIKYTNLFTKLTADVTGNGSGLTASNSGYPEKYMALHHLGINIGKKLNVGIFESVVFDRRDSLGNSQFELNYLNPIIFYRAIEQQNGSTDNALLGLDFKWLALKGISLYGQLVLDEFLLDNLREGEGWWGNKFAIQLGGEYVDAFGINNLDLQGEINLAKPYTYSHSSQYGSYSHYRQSLAHPLGANFNEFVGVVRYQPFNRLYLTAKLIKASYGLDDVDQNWGGQILKNNTTRERNLGNEIGQGQSTDLTFVDLTASYMFKHNIFIDAKLVKRDVASELTRAESNTTLAMLSLRWNIPQRLHEF